MGLMNFFKNDVLPEEATIDGAIASLTKDITSLEEVVSNKASLIVGLEADIEDKKKAVEAHKADVDRDDRIRNNLAKILK